MSGDDDLFNLIESNNNKQVRLYVYNADTDSCREVSELILYSCDLSVCLYLL